MLTPKRATLLLAVAAVALAGPAARQATDKFCEESTGLCYAEHSEPMLGITYRIATPADAAQEYDVALQIVARKQVGWAAIAWGGRMTNNPITVGWANGQDTVVSSRWATGHYLPGMYNGATYTILPESGVNDTHWTLSVLCSGCTSWNGGYVDPTSTSARFAYAMSSYGPVDRSDPSSQFGIHQAKGGWSQDMTAATDGNFKGLAESMTRES